MKESDINTIIKNSFQYGDKFFAYKIPDPPKVATKISTERPFDGFSVNNKNVIFYETKLVKGMGAFNFGLIKDHQYNFLNLIGSFNHANVKCLIIVAIWEPRTLFDLYFFNIKYIKNIKENSEKKSILKKDFELLKEKRIHIKNKVFNVHEALDKIIE